MEVSGDGVQHETACSQPLTVHVTGQHALKIAVTCVDLNLPLYRIRPRVAELTRIGCQRSLVRDED